MMTQHCLVSTAATFFVTAALLAAQTAGPQDQDARALQKRRAPVSDQAPKVRLPHIREGLLENGARLMVLEDRRIPKVTVRVRLPNAGAAYDPPEQLGVSALVAEMMTEGTRNYTSDEFAARLDRIAAWFRVDAIPAQHEARLLATSLSEHVDELLHLVGDALALPMFPEHELSLARQRTQQRAERVLTSPAFLAERLARRSLFGEDEPLPVRSSSQLTRQDVLFTHKTRFTPDGAFIGVSGDISFAEARAKLNRFWKGWRSQSLPTRSPQRPRRTPPGSRVWIMDRPNSVQATLAVIGPGVARTSPDYPALEVMNRILGGGPTNRLMTSLRFTSGYTYAAYSTVNANPEEPYWYASTSVRNAVTTDALRLLLREVQRLRQESIPDEEFQDAKQSLIGRFAVSFENSEAVLVAFMDTRQHGLPADSLATYANQIAAVTRAQVRAAAEKYLAPENLHVVAVGPIEEIRAAVTGFGHVSECSASGECSTRH